MQPLENLNSGREVNSSTIELVFDEKNSNIDELIENKPKSIGVDFEILLNPDDNQEDGFYSETMG